MARARSERISFAKIPEVLPLPDLLAVQHDSFQWFLERGLKEIFEEVSPIEDFTGTLKLELSDHRFEDPNPALTIAEKVEAAKEHDNSYSHPLFVTARFQNMQTGEIKEQQVFLGDFPMMTPNGTFIINGTERVVVSQLVRSPGVYFDITTDRTSDRDLVTAKVIPGRGAWLEFDIDKKGTLGVRVDRKRRQLVTTFLRALDFAQSDEDLLALFDPSPVISETVDKDPTEDRDEALLDLYRKLRPGELTTIESARNLVNTLFYNPKRYDLTRVGRYKINGKFERGPMKVSDLDDIEAYRAQGLGLLSREDILDTIKYLVHLDAGTPGYAADDIDHFGNRRVRTVGELVQNQIRVGLSRLERVVRERMTTQDPEAITPQSLINIRPVVASIKEFFGTSQLSQFMDQPNPLAGLTHRRRLSALGPGGLSRERAGFEVRDVHSSHYGRMCPIETPEGPNIGLIGSLASYAKVNRFGFIETPYRRVDDGRVTKQIDYLTASEEERFVIAQANAELNPDGTFSGKRVLVRRLGGEVEYVSPKQVDYMDVSPKQVVSVATSLIPFLEHDDANRALMGSNMQRQAVPLLRPEAPLVGTGVEGRVARDSGDTVIATEDGEVSEVTGRRIVVKVGNKRTEYPLKKFVRSNQGTSINQKPLVREGDTVKAGQVIADGPSTEDGELALGKNLLVAFMPWRGHNFEDAIVLSERLVKEDILTSIHIEKYEIEARDTKLGAEEITRDIPNVAEESLHDLDEEGIIRIGAEVGPNDYLVGKVTPKGETELTPEERLLRAIFGEKAREVRDMSLKVPHGEQGKAIDVRVFRRENGDELLPGVNELVQVYVGQQRKISEGDKLAGRHGNKGIIAKILPEEEMPFLEDGTPVDIILSPLGVPSRMNLGQVLETHLGWAAAQGWGEYKDKADTVASKGAKPWTKVATPVFDGTHDVEIDKLLTNALPNEDGLKLINNAGKAVLYDGRTGLPFDQPITVGYLYILKLLHLVDDKIHARSTGPYSMITQQPLGGKAQFGGQRFGEMEVWALEAYGAAYALQELLTIKSDDVRGRVKVYEAIVKGENIPEPGIPESFKVLIKEMQSLCLNVEMLSAGEEVELRELDDDSFRTAESLGIDISRPERSD